jgi:hypothetical protein
LLQELVAISNVNANIDTCLLQVLIVFIIK